MLDDPTYQDRELVQALQAHLAGALPLVFDRYGPQLFDYCHALLRDQDAASLALHDTMLTVEAHADRLRDPNELRGWLYALARRQCRRVLSGPDRPTVRREAPESPDEFATQQERQRHHDARRMVHGAMARLTGRQRESVDLTIRHGLTDTELAHVFAISLEEAAALAEGSREDLADAVEEKVGHRRISLNKLMSVLPIAQTPADLEQRVMATAIDPALAQQRAAIASRAMPFTPAGWPAEDSERSGHRATSTKTTRVPVPPPAAPVPPPAPPVLAAPVLPPVEQGPWDAAPGNDFPADRTVLDPGVFNQPPPPPPPAPPALDDTLLVGAEPPAGRHGPRSAARAASKAKQDRHGMTMWVPLAAVLGVGLLVFCLFKVVPNIGSKSASSSPSTQAVEVAPSDQGDSSADPPSKKKKTNGKPKPVTSSSPSATATASVSKTPSPSATSASPSPKPTKTVKPGTATVSGCTIPATATKCTVSITASGGKVTWTARARGKLTGGGSGTLAAGESATVTISVNKGTPCVEGSGPVFFSPGGTATVDWQCPAVEDPPPVTPTIP